MTTDAEQRLLFLTGNGTVSRDYLQDFYGLTWPFEGDLLADFNRWRDTIKNPAPNTDDQASRFEIELFLQSNGLTTAKMMAARLGMDLNSLNRFATNEKLRWLNLYRHRYFLHDGIVTLDFADDLISSLVNMRHRTFGNFNAFCHRLHSDIRTRLTANVTRLECATSQELNENPIQVANTFDCITLRPVSTKHAEWLDFRKPLRLEPDRVSKMLYARNQKDLGKYLAGTRQPDLETYRDYIKTEEGDDDR